MGPHLARFQNNVSKTTKCFNEYGGKLETRRVIWNDHLLHEFFTPVEVSAAMAIQIEEAPCPSRWVWQYTSNIRGVHELDCSIFYLIRN